MSDDNVQSVQKNNSTFGKSCWFSWSLFGHLTLARRFWLVSFFQCWLMLLMYLASIYHLESDFYHWIGIFFSSIVENQLTMTWNREIIGEDKRNGNEGKKSCCWMDLDCHKSYWMALNEIVCFLIYELETEIQLRQFYDSIKKNLSHMSLNFMLLSQDVPKTFQK